MQLYLRSHLPCCQTYFNEAPDVRRLRSEQWSIGFPVLIQILIELYLQHIVNDVRCDHQSSKGRECNDLLRPEKSGDLVVKHIRHAITLLRDGPSKNHERLAFLVQLEIVWILTPLDQDAAHIGAADETVALRGNRMGENDGQSLAEKNLDRLKQRVPLHQ